MARIYNFSKKQKVHLLWIPILKPFVKTAIIASFGMTWKVVVAGEVLCLPKSALGSWLSTAQVHLESQEVFAISIIIIALSFLIESSMKILLKKNEIKQKFKRTKIKNA